MPVARLDVVPGPQPAAAPEDRQPAPPTPPSKPKLVAPKRERAPVPEGLDARRLAAIVDAFEHDRIDIHLQPIVSLPQRKVRAYEALARLRLADESTLVPAEFMPILERCGLTAELDRRVIGKAATVARHLIAKGSDAFVSCNLSSQALIEPGFLRSVTRLLDAHPDAIGRIVLELSQRSWRTLDAETAGALGALRARGVAFALDRATDLRLDPLSLADRGVRFIKLPADLLLRPDPGREPDIALSDLVSVLGRAGIRLLAERVEREDDVPNLIDLDVPLAQGLAFAPPRAVRADVLVASAPSPVTVAEPPQATRPIPEEPDPTSPVLDEKMPFRAFLRRAS